MDAKLDGYPWLPRIIDKACAGHTGTLGAYYRYPCPMSAACLDLLGIEAELTRIEVARRPADFVRCDTNIAVKQSATTCPFANNVFYEYWTSGQAHLLRAYTPAANRVFTTHCATRTARIECTTGDGGVVRFSQDAVDRYSQSQANSSAADHDLGPRSAAPDTANPDLGASPDLASPSPDSSDNFCATHHCISNYDNGNGSTVQCADGSYSRSDGIQGACSHHGCLR